MSNTTPTVAVHNTLADTADTVDRSPQGRTPEHACRVTAQRHTTGQTPVKDASVGPGSTSLALERLLEEISNRDAETRADRLEERAYNLAQRLDDLVEMADMRGTP